MLVSTRFLLTAAKKGKYAVGAFNVYNMEGALAVIRAATELKSPVILQVLPSAFKTSGPVLISLCNDLVNRAPIPVSVHLDHCANISTIVNAIAAGILSVMVDGSDLSLEANINITKSVVKIAREHQVDVEAELGFITGEEDGGIIPDNQMQLTEPKEAALFVKETKIAALAVCIGNIHGKYKKLPRLDFERLARISTLVDTPLVMHGTSGLPDKDIQRAIQLGVSKFNVNTELRTAYLTALKTNLSQNPGSELVELMEAGIESMKVSAKSKIKLFGSNGKA